VNFVVYFCAITEAICWGYSAGTGTVCISWLVWVRFWVAEEKFMLWLGMGWYVHIRRSRSEI